MIQATGPAIPLPPSGGRRPRSLRLLVLGCTLALFAGCASIPEADREAPREIPVELPPPPQPLPDPAPSPEPEAEPVPPIEVLPPPRAAVVLSNRSPAFESVARELELLLHQPPLYNLADKSQSPEDAFATIAEGGAEVVIAIGLPAAKAASSWSSVPVVYCQVFNFDADGHPVPVKGVSSIPPLGRQLEAWIQVEAKIKSVGAILGEGHDDLLAEAAAAATASEVAFYYRIADSDRETLYLFQRMAPTIDGFWLFPDNRVLSLSVLEKITAIAARHGVRIAVFNDALLEMGASVSTAADVADIAATVVAVATRLVADGAGSLPALTPLREVRVQLPASAPASPPAHAPGSGK